MRVLFENSYKRALDRIDKREKARRRIVPTVNEATAPKPPPMPADALLSETHARSLREWMPSALQQGCFELLYRATRDGWKGKDFHERCDGYDRLLLAVRTKEGFLFGGFTDAAWPKDGGDLKVAMSRGDAFVYGLEQPGGGKSVGRARVVKCADKCAGGAKSCEGKGPGFGTSDAYVLTWLDSSLSAGKYDFGAEGLEEEEDDEPPDGWTKVGATVEACAELAQRQARFAAATGRPLPTRDRPLAGGKVVSVKPDGTLLVDFGLSTPGYQLPPVECLESELRKPRDGSAAAETTADDRKYGFSRRDGAAALLRGSNVKFESAEVEVYTVRPPKGGEANLSLTLCIEDVLGPPPDPKSFPDLRRALLELETKIGLRSVKEQVQLLVMLAQVNYERQLKGEPPQLIPLNRLFLGNPGTGKTTIAKIYGRILKGLGYLSDGSVEVRVPADLIASAVGGTEEKVNAALELCRGKVLVIDEAYQFMSTAGSYGKAAIDTIVSKVMNAPGEDIAVLLLGYEPEMKKMLRDCGNPGLSRRFSLESAFRFEDFSNEQLEQIFTAAVRRDGLSIKWKVRKAAMSLVAKERIRPHFGNAGVVENLVGEAKKRLAVKGASAYEITHESLGIDPAKEEAQLLAEIDAELGTMFKTEHLARHFAQLSALLVQYEREGKLDAMRPAAPVGSYVFTGAPGTGKTTAGRILAKFLKAKGVLVTDEFVYVSALNLQAEYVGQTKSKVDELFARAGGGMLFIDEAYNLRGGGTVFAKEAVDQLTYNLTLDAYKDRVVVVLAGYSEEMAEMMQSVNPGFASRFSQFVDFPDWDADDVVTALQRRCQREEYPLEEGALAALRRGLQVVRSRPNWGNARDADTIFKGLELARAIRLAALSPSEVAAAAEAAGGGEGGDSGGDVTRTFSTADADAAMLKFAGQRPTPATLAEPATPEEFMRELKEAGEKLVVVDFHATWCGPCKKMAPAIEKLAAVLKGRCVFLKVDVDENEQTAQGCGVQAMPTFVFFRKARPVGEKVQGADLAKLKAAINKLLASGDSGAPRLSGGDGASAPPPEICREVEREEESAVEEEPEGMRDAPSLGAILEALGWLSDTAGLRKSLQALQAVMDGAELPVEMVNFVKASEGGTDEEIQGALAPQAPGVIASIQASLGELTKFAETVHELEASGQKDDADALKREKERVTAKLKQMGACCAGFGWRKVPGGWVCSAGICKKSDDEVDDN